MRCEELPAQLAGHLSGTLAAEARDELERHLQSCPACREEAAGLTETWHLLGQLPAERPDSRAMRARFDALLQGYGQAMDQGESDAGFASPLPFRDRAGTRSEAWTRRPPRHPLWQAVAAVLVLGVGIFVGRSVAPAPAAPATADVGVLRDEVRDLRKMVALSMLQQQSASERLKGVSWTGQLDHPDSQIVTALLDTLMHDANVNVRLASIDALRRFADSDVVKRTAINALDTQTSPLVQVALIDFMVETQERTALDTLRRLSRDTMLDEAVRTRAAWGVERLETRI